MRGSSCAAASGVRDRLLEILVRSKRLIVSTSSRWSSKPARLSDQQQVPAAGIVQFVPADLEILDFANRAADRKPVLAEGGDVFVTRRESAVR
jgi:hypothetical protein